MSNRSSSKTHGCVHFNANRPKSTLARRSNKAKARTRKADALQQWQEMLKG